MEENLFVVNTGKSFEVACEDLSTAVVAHKFGVLHVHDLRETMNKKGVDFDKNVRVFEVCNPHKAKEVLEINLLFNLGLPCRISVFEDVDGVKIGMIKPTVILGVMGSSADNESTMRIAEEVTAITERIIHEAAGV